MKVSMTAARSAPRGEPAKVQLWRDDEKARLIAETLLPAANVSAIARAAGLVPSQLYGWRRKAIVSAAVAPRAETVNEDVEFARVEPVAGSTVEIAVRDFVVRVTEDIEPDHLARILWAVPKP